MIARDTERDAGATVSARIYPVPTIDESAGIFAGRDPVALQPENNTFPHMAQRADAWTSQPTDRRQDLRGSGAGPQHRGVSCPNRVADLVPAVVLTQTRPLRWSYESAVPPEHPRAIVLPRLRNNSLRGFPPPARQPGLRDSGAADGGPLQFRTFRAACSDGRRGR